MSDVHWADLSDLWQHPGLKPTDLFATAGSCFAQHIGRYLARQDCGYLDMEPPPSFLNEKAATSNGFGIYSCRYGNVYTTRQLRQLMEEAFGDRATADIAWEREGRWFDAMRPSVDPAGHASAKMVYALRIPHLARGRKMFESLNVFVFTLGLTEVWESVDGGTAFPSAPGVIAGSFDSAKYALRLLRHDECLEDLEYVRSKLHDVNPSARMILTVSPVPLVATATDEHVLPATMQSKSTLRSVAGEMARHHDDVAYFPSYEIIAAHPGRATFFEADLRTVNAAGVRYVMSHFFNGWLDISSDKSEVDEYEVICDEEAVDT